MAEAAFAARFTQQRRERAAARAAQRQSTPRQPPVDGILEGVSVHNESQHVSYSTNWAGAVLVGTGYKVVTGTITVPEPSVPAGSSKLKQYAASAWVGIDGDTCQTAILQTGVDFYATATGVSFDAWYEWYPNYAYDFTGIAISVGDEIKMTVYAITAKAGLAVIENLTTGKTVQHEFVSQTASLCMTNAEWIVEDFESGSALVAFADFGSVTFTDISPSASGAEILDIKQTTVLTSCSATDATVTCTYV
ncbi:peptidase A4 family-domain-containing protein [Xylariales sp. PMI_506]|nr:peptidase A4 family-domain-containing protein [Xylariales sp. PMI_506]